MQDPLSCNCETPEVLLGSLDLLSVKRQPIGWWKRERIGLSGCDASATSFICQESRVSVNEVVKGGNICGGDEGKGFSESL